MRKRHDREEKAAGSGGITCPAVSCHTWYYWARRPASAVNRSPATTGITACPVVSLKASPLEHAHIICEGLYTARQLGDLESQCGHLFRQDYYLFWQS